MKRFALWALVSIALMFLFVPFVALAVDEQPDPQTINLIWMSAGSLAAFAAGLLVKAVPQLPNETIPYLTCAIAIGGFVLLGDMPFKAAVLLAMAVAHGATLVAEGGKLVAKMGGGGAE